MKRLLTIPAYLWAIACLLLIPVTFIGNESFAGQMAKLKFMKVNPVYTGGEITDSVNEPDLDTYIYKPVFEAFIGESKEGFIQVKFSSPSDTLPEIITKTIDYNLDDSNDFILEVNTATGKTIVTSMNPLVEDVNISSRLKNEWVVRVGLKNLLK